MEAALSRKAPQFLSKQTIDCTFQIDAVIDFHTFKPCRKVMPRENTRTAM